MMTSKGSGAKNQQRKLNRALSWLTSISLTLSLLVPTTVLAHHDPFFGNIFGKNDKLELEGVPHEGFCHSLDGDNYQHLNTSVNSIINVPNGHGIQHEFDIIPPFHYDLGDGGGEQTYDGNLWTPENIEFLINGCKAAPPATYSISGTKYDYNTEAGLEGWTIFLDEGEQPNGELDPGEQFVVTDENGDYTFTDLPEGTYIVREDPQDGWQQMSPLDPDYHQLNLPADAGGSFDFSNQQLFSISGTKFNDLNGENGQEEGELGLEGWTIFIDEGEQPNGELDPGEQFVVTDENGDYTFAGLPAGAYTVAEVLQPGWVQTYPETGSHSVTLGPDAEDVNFGNQEEIATELTIDASKWAEQIPEQPQLVDYYIDWSVIGEGTLFDAVVTDFMPDGTTFVFGDGVESGGEITFDLGDITADDDGILNFRLSIDAFDEANRWADFVHFFNQGTQKDGDPVDASRSDPTKALGEAQDDDTENFVSLGFDGDIALGWDHFIVNGPGDDIRIFETSFGDPDEGDYPETVEVYASQNGSDWTLLGTIVLDGTVDLGSMNWARYVKLVDVSDPNDFESPDADGFDVDGVYATNFLPDICEIENTGEFSGYTEAEQGGDPLSVDFSHTLQVNPYACQAPPEPSTYSISGTKFRDFDGDGERGESESGVFDWTIYIDENENGQLDDGELTATTGEDGSYSLSGLEAGTHIVREVNQENWVQTYPGENNNYEHTVVIESESAEGVDFGNQPTGSGVISGVVFHDVDQDATGEMDEGDEPLNQWEVYLDLDEDDTLSAGDISTVTAEDGSYSFENLPDGTYYVRQVLVGGDWSLIYPTPQDDGEYVVTIISGITITSVSSQPILLQAVASDGTDVNFANYLQSTGGGSGSTGGGGGGTSGGGGTPETSEPEEGGEEPEEVLGEQEEESEPAPEEEVLGEQDEGDQLPAAGPEHWMILLISLVAVSLVMTYATRGVVINRK